MNTHVYMFVTFVALFALTANAMPKCTVGAKPFELSNIGKGSFGYGGCSRGGSTSRRSFKFHSWGLQYFPLFGYGFTCQDDFVITYRKLNQPAMIYYRPAPKPEDFKTIAPKEYAEFKRDGITSWPCNKIKIPVQKVHVWKQRALFVRLIKQAAEGVQDIRDYDCYAPPGPWHDPKQKFSWTELRKKIAEDRVRTAALNFLHGVAYSNFFCV